jgi:tRNA(Ile)-lysidine synthase
LGRARAALDQAVAAAALARVELHPAGFARLDPRGLDGLADEVGLRLLARLLAAIGGEPLPPRHERLERLALALRPGPSSAQTLAGCRVVPEEGGGWIVCREPARAAPPVALIAGTETVWDRRFLAQLAADAPVNLRLGALGASPGRALTELARRRGLPACVRPTIPALFDQQGVFAVPHLGYNRDGARQALRGLAPAPAQSLTAAGSHLVPFGSRPISMAISSA